MIDSSLTEYFNGKNILVTGHTGFKGTWLTRILTLMGANVYGLALEPQSNSMFSRFTEIGMKSHSFIDIREAKKVSEYFSANSFHGIFHLAAQPLVLTSYEEPLETFQTNVLGTANILQSSLTNNTIQWAIVVTTDKVYKNTNDPQGYQEDNELQGSDPYSASKVCTEMVAIAWRNLAELYGSNIRICTVRAGNVIGGGDISANRLLPDLINSFKTSSIARIRNPNAIRPWQHVIDPLCGYMLLAKHLATSASYPHTLNFGPSDESKLTVQEVSNVACALWPGSKRYSIEIQMDRPREAQNLWLNSGKAREILGWENKLSAEKAISWTIEWERRASLEKVSTITDIQIARYFEGNL